MAAGVPPPPLNSPSGSYYWLEWYTSLTNFLNGTNIPWSNLNFTGSNLTDIQTRNHNDLQNIQGGTGTTEANGKHWHLAGQEFIGGVNSAGTAVFLPAGWTVAVVGTNYTVTHNLALTTTNHVVMAVSTGGAGVVNNVSTGTNSFVVTTSVAAGFNFVLTQGS